MPLKKILLVANTDWYLFRFRLALARYLRAQGFSVTLVSPPGQFTAQIEQAGFSWREWQVGRQSMNIFAEIGAVMRLFKLYRFERPSFVHHFTVKPVLYGSLAARLAGVPAVVNAITGLGYVFLQSGWRGGLLQKVVLALYRLAFGHRRMHVIFENDQDRDFFLAKGLVNPAGATVIEGVGVDLDEFSPAAEPPGDPLVVLPARMLWDKGVGVLVESARLMKAQRIPLRMALVGPQDPGNPASIPDETLKDWTAEGVVEWWGFRQDMPDIFRQACLVVLPSMGEGLPTVLLEAAACGRAVIATDVPGCRQAVVDGETGLLVPPSDPAALATAIWRLIADPALRRSMGDAGRRRVEALYSDRSISERTVAVYQKLLPG